MRLPIIASAIVFAFVAEDVLAACPGSPGDQVRNTPANADLTNLLSGSTVCVGSSPVWTAQEEHRGGGELWDYKKGPPAPGNVDPTKKLGTWSVTGNGANTIVTYVYDRFAPPVAGPYSFKVYATPATGIYDFCGEGGADDVEGARVQPGSGPC